MKHKKTILNNGLRVVTVSKPDSPTTTVLVMVEAGTKYETEKTNGLSHFLEHMCFKGTINRGSKAIAYEIETLGAETNAFTWYDYTGYYIKGASRHASKFLEIVSDVFLHSTFPKEEIEKERGVICGEIDMYQDIPQRQAGTALQKALYGNQPAGMTVLGPKENILRFSQKDFIAYHKKHYTAGATSVVVVGNVSHADVVRQVKQLFKELPKQSAQKKKPLAKTTGDKKTILNKKTDQSHIALGIRLPGAEHPDMSALVVATCILGNGMGSRLFLRLREEMGAGYYVRASLTAFDDGSDISIVTGTEPSRVSEVTSAIFDEIQKLSTEEITNTDIARAQEYLVGGLYMGYESTDDIAYSLGHYETLHLPLKTLAEREKKIRSITIHDIARVAKKYLIPEKFHTVVVGPTKKK
ncbi:MAG: insulinase family protein [Candidatus Pacebacteria bacterium]|nr:insulinase family protein [Candidatus Paceibacterota bacterium]